MKRNIAPKTILFSIVLCSIVSAVYLEFQRPEMIGFLEDHRFAEIYIKEGGYLPDVKFVKELLKTIFNVMTA